MGSTFSDLFYFYFQRVKKRKRNGCIAFPYCTSVYCNRVLSGCLCSRRRLHYKTEWSPPVHSGEQRAAVLILLVVLYVLSTSAPAAGRSGRKVNVWRLPPLYIIRCLARTRDWYFAVSPVNETLRVTVKHTEMVHSAFTVLLVPMRLQFYVYMYHEPAGDSWPPIVPCLCTAVSDTRSPLFRRDILLVDALR